MIQKGHCKLGCTRLSDNEGRCCSTCELNGKNRTVGWRTSVAGCAGRCDKILSNPNDPTTCINWVVEEIK